MMATAEKSDAIKKEDLEEFVKLDAEKRELEQKARVIGKRTDALKAHFKLHLENRKKKSIKKHGFHIHLEEGRPIVSYQQICVDKLGPLVVDEIVSQAPRSVKVVVEKV